LALNPAVNDAAADDNRERAAKSSSKWQHPLLAQIGDERSGGALAQGAKGSSGVEKLDPPADE
jgi:hypothetical protein